jgi:hypothetical protein
MPRLKSLTLLMVLLLSAFLAGCPRWFKPKVKLEDLTRHEIKQIATWNEALSRPVGERIFTAPPNLIDYLDKDNRYNGFDGVPKAAPLTPDLRADIAGAIDALPPKLRTMLGEKLIGVFVVKGLGSSAYTDYVRDEKKRPRFAFIVVDVDAMNRKANDWMGWKESSPFLPDPDWRIEGVLEDPAHDTTGKALEYVLIHEFGHALAFNSDVHPLWSLSSKRVDVEDYPFMDLAWAADPGSDGYLRKIEKTAPLPGTIIYYKPSVDRPKASEIPAYYDWLQKTDFVTLYGATNPYDDFAEALVSYVHSVIQKRPWEIRIFHKGQLLRTLKPCWDEPRCAEKRQALEEFLN